MRVLVVEDNEKMAGLLRRGLIEAGYAVDVALAPADALVLATDVDYDAILLDIMFGPKADGFDICARLRGAGRWSPVIMLTARDAVADLVAGLDVGADDYITKPFDFAELLARLRAVIRRGARRRPAVIVVDDLHLDPARHRVDRGGVQVDLTAKEFALLEYLMRHPGEVRSRSDLVAHVWDFAFDCDSNLVDVHVRNLRRKIDEPFGTRTLETVRGVGYRLRDECLAPDPA